MNTVLVEHLAGRLAEIPGVAAVTLGGSRATVSDVRARLELRDAAWA